MQRSLAQCARRSIRNVLVTTSHAHVHIFALRAINLDVTCLKTDSICRMRADVLGRAVLSDSSPFLQRHG